jgi:hypothetical protein
MCIILLARGVGLALDHVLEETSTGGQAVERGVALTTSANLASDGEGLVLTGEVTVLSQQQQMSTRQRTPGEKTNDV